MIENWPALATTDPHQIRLWWTAWPDANIGGAMGPDLIAIDIDPAKGGDDSWESLGLDEDTLTTRTGSGGTHLFYLAAPHQDVSRLRNRQEVLPGIDVRAAGGYVVLPGSVHECGGEYEWLCGISTAELPDELYDLIASDPAAERAPEHTPRSSPPLGERILRAQKHVRELSPAISGRGGHSSLFTAACAAVRGYDLPRPAARLVLEEFNERCIPPWSPVELEHKLAQAEASSSDPWGFLIDAEEMAEALAPNLAPAASAPVVEASTFWTPWRQICAPLPTTHWYVRDLQICPGRPMLVAGYGASGKTLVLQAMLVALAARKPVWGTFPGSNVTRVRHFDHEQGAYATHRRYQRLARGLAVPEDAELDLGVAVFPALHLNQKGAADQYAKVCEGVHVAVLDALRGATPGEDENDSKIRSCIDVLSWVSDRTGTAFILVHHAGKTSAEDKRQTPRGSSAIFDGCGAAYTISAESAGSVKLVEQVRPASEAEGQILEPFGLSIEDVDGTAGVRVSYQRAETNESPDDRFTALVRDVTAFVGAHPGAEGVRAIAARMGLPLGTARTAVDVLTGRKEIVNRGTDKNPRLYLAGSAPPELVVGDI